MKRITPILIAFAISSFSAKAQIDTISIDLGNNTLTSPSPWNNLTNEDDGSIANLLNHNGFTTGYSVAVTDSFNGNNTAGLVSTNSLFIGADNACKDSFFGSKVPAVEGHQPTGGITFYHLDPNETYSFYIYASRGSASNNRETKYIIDGAAKDSANLNAASNAADIVQFVSVSPKADSTLTITATTGPNNNDASGYYYFGALKMTYASTGGPAGPKNLSIIFPNGNELWEETKTPKIKWTSQNVINLDIEYSTDAGSTWKSVAAGVNALSGQYNWTVPSDFSSDALVRLVDASDNTVGDTSDATFSIVPLDSNQYRIVVCGSSTAAGTGPSSLDSAWVWRYQDYLSQNDTRFEVINLAVGGYRTSNIIPAGNPNNNITKAMSYAPDAVIVNLPSNDAAGNIPVTTQLANYDLIAQAAAAGGASLWVTTPQPRNFTNPSQLQIQFDMVDSTYAIFGNFAIDFWTGFAKPDGTMENKFNSGDGVHMNDTAHLILFERVIGKNIKDYVIQNPNPYNDSTVSVMEYGVEGLKIYPNPVSELLFIDASETNNASLKSFILFDMNGRSVLKGALKPESDNYLNLSDLPAGIYQLQVLTNKGKATTKVLLQ